MNKWRWLKSAVFFCVFFIVGGSWAAEFPTAPQPFRYINDYTNTLSTADKNTLEQALTQYGQETSSQIAVVIIPTVGEYDIAQYTFELGDKWGIGRKQLNNGVLMLIAKNDRKIFIATGQGLEGVLPDAFLSQLIRQKITPYFAQDQYAQGIANGLSAIMAASQGEYAALEAEDEHSFEDIIPFIMIGIFILIVIFGEISARRRPYISPTNNHSAEQILRQGIRHRSRRAGYGSGIGGGFGGFGGGGSSGGGFGGGSFGGGGAGGSW
ncbi:TPM domain-containing protein [Conservatibacter flavescens]|uniref:Methanol dehydrogenase n=1 Tax=Conservatibacter flavescens TaxID=28161 RepID=A0A2M8S552_9PAST|nr:TPM domain-containing protein [Conservatibacter flavescens]PJG86269.1 methanol dehydrogenase [Conservatibacter flavescens]